MKKLHYFVSTEPFNYNEVNSDTMRHLKYADYKHLAGVQWHDTESLTSDDYLSIIGLLIGFITIIGVLFLGG